MAKLITIPTKGILSYFTRHRTAANLLLVILLALGVAAVPRMRAQFFPDIVVDDSYISVSWDGAGATDGVDYRLFPERSTEVCAASAGGYDHWHGAFFDSVWRCRVD